MLTQERLKELLHYDPLTGIFTRITTAFPKPQFKVGDTAGCKQPNGYISIQIDGKHYRAHNLAWLYMNGSFSKLFLDHKNTVRDDNRIKNLREATRSQNGMNSKMKANNTSGFKGVRFYRANGKWRARARLDGKTLHLGYFSTPELASEAYQSFASLHHGEFKHQAS